jgi:hypothetical protein
MITAIFFHRVIPAGSQRESIFSFSQKELHSQPCGKDEKDGHPEPAAKDLCQDGAPKGHCNSMHKN